MQDLAKSVARFLDGGQGLWLAEGESRAPDGTVVVATSGSSGDAKLVVLSRAALIAAARCCSERLGFAGRWHLTLSPHYVAGLMVLVRGLLGEGLVVADPRLATLHPRGEGDCVSIVGTQLYRALEQPEVAERLARFDAVLVGGAALRPDLRERARRAGIDVIETYGMSETCGGVVWDGVPLPGVDVRLGELGRVAIAGPSVFDGYLGRPELTAETLVDGAVVTRDRAHWEGGRLVIDGRLDDVVISGGVNVDLAEVRAAAARLEPDTAVLAVEDPEWGARVVLFAPSGSIEQWRNRLKPSLPAAWLPRQVVLVDGLPRGLGGKPDREKLLRLVQP